MELREHCEVAGLHVSSWLSLYMACHSFVMGHPVRTGWPDGRSTLEQAAVTVRMFDVVTDELMKEQEAQRKQNDAR